MRTSRIILFTALGVAFWFVAAMLVRLLGTTVFTENNPMLVLIYLLGIPITGGFVYITKTVSNLNYSELLKPIVVVTLTAACLDGIALAWFRQLYSQSFEVALHGAALILWGVGLGLVVAFILDIRSN